MMERNWLKISLPVQRITGYAVEELLGENPIDYAHPDDRQKVLDHLYMLHLLMRLIRMQEIEYRFKHKNGDYVWLLTNAAIAFSYFGNGERMIITSSVDISIRKEQEKALAEKHQESMGHQSSFIKYAVNPHFFLQQLKCRAGFCVKDTLNAINFISDFSVLMRGVLSNSMKTFMKVLKKR